MKKEVIGSCPICTNELKVTKLTCDSCGTNIDGEFELCNFCKLSGEERAFLEVFIKNRGNIKVIEKELNISYPTVKSRLDNLIKSLGYEVEEKENSVDKKEVLSKLNNGEISTEDALKLLRKEG